MEPNRNPKDIRAGEFFRAQGSAEVGTIYGECIERHTSTTIVAEVFSKLARAGDSGMLPISQIREIVSENEFDEEVAKFRMPY